MHIRASLARCTFQVEELGTWSVIKTRAVNFKFWMGGGLVPPHRGVPEGGYKGAMGGGLARDSLHSSQWYQKKNGRLKHD